MLLSEAKEILEQNGYILESEEISIDDLVAFAKLNCSKAMGAAVSVKDRCEWPLVEIDITGDAVFKKYNGTCITGYFKERTGAGARRGASKYFSIFPEESKLVVGPGTSERVNGKLCRLITNEYTYNSWDDLIKFFNRNNFNTTKLPKTFSEAKEILENSGYCLVEANMSLKDKLATVENFNTGNTRKIMDEMVSLIIEYDVVPNAKRNVWTDYDGDEPYRIFMSGDMWYYVIDFMYFDEKGIIRFGVTDKFPNKTRGYEVGFNKIYNMKKMKTLEAIVKSMKKYVE